MTSQQLGSKPLEIRTGSPVTLRLKQTFARSWSSKLSSRPLVGRLIVFQRLRLLYHSAVDTQHVTQARGILCDQVHRSLRSPRQRQELSSRRPRSITGTFTRCQRCRDTFSVILFQQMNPLIFLPCGMDSCNFFYQSLSIRLRPSFARLAFILRGVTMRGNFRKALASFACQKSFFVASLREMTPGRKG